MEYELRIDFNFISEDFYEKTQKLAGLQADRIYHRTKYMSMPTDLRLTLEYQIETNKYLILKYGIKTDQKWHLRHLHTTQLGVGDSEAIPTIQYQLKTTESMTTDYLYLKNDIIPMTRSICREIELDPEDLTRCSKRINTSGQYHLADDVAPKQMLQIDQYLYYCGRERFTFSKTIHQNEKTHYSFHIEREFPSLEMLHSFDAQHNMTPFAMDLIYQALINSTRSEVYEFINPLCIWKLYNLNKSRAFKLTNRKIRVEYMSPKLDGTRVRGAVVCGKLLTPSTSPSLDQLSAQFEALKVYGNYFVVIEEMATRARIIDVFGVIEARYAIYNSKVINNKHHSLTKSRKLNTFESIELMNRWGPMVCNSFYRLVSKDPAAIHQLVQNIHSRHVNEQTDGLLAFGSDKQTIYKLKKHHTIELAYTVTGTGHVRVHIPMDVAFRVRLVIDTDYIVKTDKLYANFGRPLLEFELTLCGDGTVVATFLRHRFDKFIPDSGVKFNNSVNIMLTTMEDELYSIV